MKITEILKKKKRKFLSIDFGQAFVKIVYIESLGQRFSLLNYDFKRIPALEENKTEIINFIKDFIKLNAIPEKEVSLTLSDPESIIIKHLILPVVPKEEILQAIKWQLKGETHFDLENTAFDWQIVKEYTDEEGARKNEIMCIFVKPELIDKYLSIIEGANLTPFRISSSHFNYADILRYLKGNPAIVAIMDIGYKSSVICIYNNNRLDFIRSLTLSSEKLTQSLTGTLVSGNNKTELSYEKAEEIKNTFGIPKDTDTILQDNIQAIQVISLMRPLLETMVKELNRSFEYFTSHFKEEHPAILYLSGGGSNLKNLDWYLNNEFKIKVLKLPLPDCINLEAIDKEKLKEDQLQIMSAMGAGLADCLGINLLPQEIRTQKVEVIEKVSLRFVAIILGAVFLFSFLVTRFEIYDYRKRLKNAQIHLQTIEAIKVLKQEIDARESLINKIQKNKVPVDGLLKLIGTVIPGSIILDELFLDQGTHILTLKGVVSGTDNIAESVLTNFMQKLETSSFLSECNLIFSKKTSGIHEFELKCDLAR